MDWTEFFDDQDEAEALINFRFAIGFSEYPVMIVSMRKRTMKRKRMVKVVK